MKRLAFDSRKHQHLLERSSWTYSLPVPGYGIERDSNGELDPTLFHGTVPMGGRMLSASLGDDLAQWFGPSDETVPGKYRKAQAFYFDAGDHGVVAAVCEKGDRGSSWYWIPRDLKQARDQYPGGNVIMGFTNAPEFWPGMLMDLGQRMKEAGLKLDLDALARSMQHAKVENQQARTPKTGPK